MADKTIELGTRIMDASERISRENRERLDEHGIFMLNLLSSPGSGKTSTILATIRGLAPDVRVAVIEGDIASDVDAQTIKAAGSPAVQINTGGICHLEGDMIRQALDALDLSTIDLIIIENVGNLVCPVDFYLGEDATAMILSVPEGDDKPLKYPGVFQAADAIILNKADTLPVFDFDSQAFHASLADLNPSAPIFEISATKGDGVDGWVTWLRDRMGK